MYRRIRKPEGFALGGTSHKFKWGRVSAGSQRTQAGGLSGTDTEQSVLERFGCGKRNKYHISEHQIDTGGRAGGSALSIEAS